MLLAVATTASIWWNRPMKFTIAIEPGTENAAFGVVVPDLPGCFSAGDTSDQAFVNAHEAIDTFCRIVAEDGGDLPKTRQMCEWQKDSQFNGWKWAVIDVPVEKYFGQ